MPYIDPAIRVKIDNNINDLVESLRFVCAREKNPLAYAGILNYTITRLIREMMPIVRTYGDYALMTGMLENVKQELYRREISIYEDEKKEINGDVY
jgi:hypothetical protein